MLMPGDSDMEKANQEPKRKEKMKRFEKRDVQNNVGVGN